MTWLGSGDGLEWNGLEWNHGVEWSGVDLSGVTFGHCLVKKRNIGGKKRPAAQRIQLV